MADKYIEIHVQDGDIQCPVCGAPEVDDSVDWHSDGDTYHPFWIRAYKVDNYHHCLWCDSWFHDDGDIERSPVAQSKGRWVSQPNPR